MVNPGGSSQPPPVGTGSLSWKRCAGCGGKIADRFLLYTMDSYWHSRCLKCSCCQAQLGEIGTSCYTKSGMILCRNDYIRLFGNSGACSACGQSIPASELVMRAQGNVYHLKCFTCSTCRNRLVPGDRFHYINGSLFCEHDRPTALMNGHLSSLQTNPLLPDQKGNITNDEVADLYNLLYVRAPDNGHISTAFGRIWAHGGLEMQEKPLEGRTLHVPTCLPYRSLPYHVEPQMLSAE
ncbi:hypothetical protein F2P81_006093 [Scophthalmus maximus]|uniref:LIM zinc-binding domain-containing protein n=1 Tax=Scophthalmus maximus TaxID=52904 RepID=A0A6A4TI86_SCOMX|nr:hypothetical protein F2P81_006093 [Scophthalmus maximus]